MYKSILIPTDGGEFANQAVKQGLSLAKELGARVTLVRVVRPPDPIVIEGVVVSYPPEELTRQIKAKAEASLTEHAAEARRLGVACETALPTNALPWRGILDIAAERHCDLIVMASHGRRGISALLLGSETQKVLTHASIPVLVIR
jgi:nucleotide-binding universal stress UspA family protein